MARLMSWIGVAIVVGVALALGARPSDSPASAARLTEQIAAELRCPVCQGLSVADSDSPTARDIRTDIRSRIETGNSPAEIRQAYVDRYGQWVLLRPDSAGFSALAWAIPVAALVAGLLCLATAFWRWRWRRGRQPTDDDRRVVAAARRANASA